MRLEIELPDEQVEQIARRAAELMSVVQKRLLSVPESAAYYGRSEAAIRAKIKKGHIPDAGDDGRVMVDRHDLDQLIEEAKRRKRKR